MWTTCDRRKGTRAMRRQHAAVSGRMGRMVMLGGCVLALVAGCSSGSGGASSNPAPPPRSRPSSAPASAQVTGQSPIFDALGWLACQTTDGADDRVHLVRVDGSDDHAIASELSGRTAHPDFSSDGRHLVIDELASEADVDQIYIGDGNGDHFRLMARCAPPACLDHWEAAWSPDGQRLVMSTAGGRLTEQAPTRFGLAVVATQSVHTILDHPSRDGQDHFARWSPDGQSLIFWRERGASEGSPQSAIFRIDADGARLHRLTAWSLAAGDPDWSPDGSSIVFSTHPLLIFEGGAESELYAMKPDGTGLRQLTHDGDGGPRATQPRWTRDGTAIVYVETGSGGFPRHISAIRPDGTDDASVLAERDLYTHPTLQPPV
jgi:Tol biopolymer transport system component